MNRAQRRANKVKGKQPTYNMSQDQIKGLKDDATADAVDIAFKLLVCIPVMVIHDKYAQLMRKEVNGKSREERMAEFVLDLYDSVMRDYVTLEELEQCLLEETGMRFEK